MADETEKRPVITSQPLFAGLGVLKNIAKLTGKHMPKDCNFFKKETLAQVFSCKF